MTFLYVGSASVVLQSKDESETLAYFFNEMTLMTMRKDVVNSHIYLAHDLYDLEDDAIDMYKHGYKIIRGELPVRRE
jgi:hypothetical protein